MGISTQTITVDLSKQLTRPQVVRLGQGDKLGTTLVADIHDNGVAYNLTGKTARFSMRAPDGSSSYSVVASSYNGNKATFDIDETYAASIAGKTDTAYIEVLSGSTVICSTSRITVIVYRSASQGLPVSGAYSDALEEAIAAANTATAEVREAMGDISELAVPEMTASVRGGAKLGTGLAVVDGTLGVDLSNVNTGVLPVARGGTGVTTAAAERGRLGLGSTTGALPIANGGTGASNAAGARTALGLGSLATLSSLDLVSLAEDGSAVDSSARSSGANYRIDITLEPMSGYKPIAVIAVSADSANARLRGFDLDGVSTGGTPKVKTYWNASGNMSANTVTYNVQVLMMKTTLP